MKLAQTCSLKAALTCARHAPLALSGLCIGLSLGGCLDRPDSETVGYSAHVLEPNAEVRPWERNLDAQKKLDANDGLPAEVLLRTGYFDGNLAYYWDLGQAPTNAEPMWVLVRGPFGRGAPIEDHPPILDSIPGDSSYSPMRIIFDVHVTDKYRGERIPSLRALEDAIELGLVRDPELSGYFTNCVVTLEAVTFESGFDMPPLQPTSAYYRGREVFQFCVQRDYDEDGGGLPAEFTLNNGSVYYGNAYSLRRRNSTSLLDEPGSKRDLNDDGDMLDVDVVFDVQPEDDAYSSLWKSFEVIVPPDHELGALDAVGELFDKEPGGMTAKEPVVSFSDTTLIVNRPIRRVVVPE